MITQIVISNWRAPLQGHVLIRNLEGACRDVTFNWMHTMNEMAVLSNEAVNSKDSL